jgi:hypothetical protein
MKPATTRAIARTKSSRSPRTVPSIGSTHHRASRTGHPIPRAIPAVWFQMGVTNRPQLMGDVATARSAATARITGVTTVLAGGMQHDRQLRLSLESAGPLTIQPRLPTRVTTHGNSASAAMLVWCVTA